VPAAGTILIVDDDRDLLSALRDLLDAAGWTVVAAPSADAALAAAKAHRVDVILTDILMPGTDGPAFSAMLRADAALASIPVLFMTGSLRHARALEGEVVISKPFDVSRLLDLLGTKLPTR
jgi:CheY-like chemotaxis protein